MLNYLNTCATITKYIVTRIIRYNNKRIDFQKNSEFPNKSEIKFGKLKYVIRKSFVTLRNVSKKERTFVI